MNSQEGYDFESEVFLDDGGAVAPVPWVDENTVTWVDENSNPWTET